MMSSDAIIAVVFFSFCAFAIWMNKASEYEKELQNCKYLHGVECTIVAIPKMKGVR